MKRAKIVSATATFIPESNFKYVKILVQKEKRGDFDEVSQNNYMGLVFLVIATLAFLNQSQVRRFSFNYIFCYLVYQNISLSPSNNCSKACIFFGHFDRGRFFAKEENQENIKH